MSFKKFILLCCFLALSFQKIQGCTGIIQKAENGDWVYSRTMEFGVDMMSFDLFFIPRGLYYDPPSWLKQPSAAWTTKYAYVGFGPFGLPSLVDGLNEKGLAAGAFFFPGWAQYQKVDSKEQSKAVSNIDFVSWVLGNFSTVAEAREALKNTKVVGIVFEPWKMVPPIHYIVTDKTGDRIVVEYVDGNQRIYDAPIGTITNAPTYDWHSLNARNYIGLKALNNPSIAINGKQLAQFSQGSGAIGLPGDFTSPSRFIRASFLNQVVLAKKDGQEQVERAFKILNQFDIPKGAVRAMDKGKEKYEETQWTSASDLSNSRYYFHTNTSRMIRFIDLKSLDLDAKEIKSISVDTPETFVDITSSIR